MQVLAALIGLSELLKKKQEEIEDGEGGGKDIKLEDGERGDSAEVRGEREGYKQNTLYSCVQLSKNTF